MTGQELIDKIHELNLEDYTFEVDHDVCMGAYPIKYLDVNEEDKTVEIV